MCLFPMGGGGLNMQPVVPPTPLGVKHRKRLYMIALVHLILSIIFMFINFIGGLYELMTVLILWCAASQMHFCTLIMYMVLCLNNLIAMIALIGLLI